MLDKWINQSETTGYFKEKDTVLNVTKANFTRNNFKNYFVIVKY